MGLTDRVLDRAADLAFLVQWVLYRAVLAVDPLRERVPGLGRDPGVWVFGARGGAAFADNAKYLYLHVAAERPEVRPVWLSKDAGVVADLQSAGYEAYHCYSLRGLAVGFRAGTVAFTHGFRDLAIPCCAGATAVQLWHGVPLKRVSWDAAFADQPLPVRLARADAAGEVDLLVVPGRALVDAFRSGLRVDPDRMVLAGYPRNDALFGPIPGEEVGTDAAALDAVRTLADESSLVVYLPTFREWTDASATDRLDVAALEEFLAERDAVLAVKPHPAASVDLPDDCSRVVELPAATDPYPLLRDADALVTDYSSVAFDFLLVDRPMAFYPFDLEAYRARRGFSLDYASVTAGPVARDFEGLLDALDRALTSPDADAADRRTVRERLLDADPAVSGQPAGDAATWRSATVHGVPRSATVYEAPRSATVYEAVRREYRATAGRRRGRQDY